MTYRIFRDSLDDIESELMPVPPKALPWNFYVITNQLRPEF